MAWRLTPGQFRGLGGQDLAALGIPTEAEYVAAYCRRTGRARIDDFEFYLVFNMFRIAAILHGVLARAQHGNAASARRARHRRPRAPRRRRRVVAGPTPLGHTPMDFQYAPQGARPAGARRAASWTSTCIPPSGVRRRGGREPRAGQPVGAHGDHGGAEGEGAAAGPVEPVPARVRPRRRADQSRIRAAVRDHGPLVDRPRRCSTATRRTPATWKCSCATARPSRRRSGWRRSSPARSARPSR